MADLEHDLQEAYRKFSAADAAGDTESAKAFKEFAIQTKQKLDAQAEPEKGKTSNVVAGVADSALGIGQGLANLVDRGGQYLEDKLGGKDYGVFYNENDGVHFSRSPNDATDNTTIRDVGKTIQKTREDIGYRPSTSVDDVKDNFWAAIPFAAERAATSIPYLLSPQTAIAGGLGTVGSTVEQRMDNDRRNAPTGMDFLAGAATGATDLALNKYLRATGAGGLGSNVSRIGRGTVIGAGEGALQEYSTKAGTEAEGSMNLGDAALEGAGSALGAGTLSAGVHAAAPAARAVAERVPSLSKDLEMPGMKPFLARVVKEQEASNLKLKDIEPNSIKGAKVAVDNVHSQLRSELVEETKALKKMMPEADGNELQARLDKATFNAISTKARNKVKNTVSDEDKAWLTDKFGDKANRIIGLIDESNAMTTFTRGGLQGGIGGALNKVGLSGGALPTVYDAFALSTGGIPAATAVRLGAYGVDTVTGRRSRLDRAVRAYNKLSPDTQAAEPPVRPSMDAEVATATKPAPMEDRRPNYDENLAKADIQRLGGYMPSIRQNAFEGLSAKGIAPKKGSSEAFSDALVVDALRKTRDTFPDLVTKDYDLEAALAKPGTKIPPNLMYKATEVLAHRIVNDPELRKHFDVPDEIAQRADAGEIKDIEALDTAVKELLTRVNKVTGQQQSPKSEELAREVGRDEAARDADKYDDFENFTGKVSVASSRKAKRLEDAPKVDEGKNPVRNKQAYEAGIKNTQKTYEDASNNIASSDLPSKVKRVVQTKLDTLKNDFKAEPEARQRIVDELKAAYPDHAEEIGQLLEPFVSVARRNARTSK